jgi:hypothetical protein
MLIPLRRVLLAATWLAPVALTVGCGEPSVEEKAKQLDRETRIYGTTAAAAAAALSKVKAPAGFRAVPCGAHASSTYATCFDKQRSVVLDDPTLPGLVAASGTRPWHGLGPVFVCPGHPVTRFGVPRVRLDVCAANVIIGPERLTLFITSVVLAGPRGMTGTTRAVRGVARGTKIEANVVGHFVHNGAQEGEGL